MTRGHNTPKTSQFLDLPNFNLEELSQKNFKFEPNYLQFENKLFLSNGTVVYECELCLNYLKLANNENTAILTNTFPRVKASVIWRLFENYKKILRNLLFYTFSMYVITYI